MAKTIKTRSDQALTLTEQSEIAARRAHTQTLIAESLLQIRPAIGGHLSRMNGQFVRSLKKAGRSR